MQGKPASSLIVSVICLLTHPPTSLPPVSTCSPSPQLEKMAPLSIQALLKPHLTLLLCLICLDFPCRTTSPHLVPPPISHCTTQASSLPVTSVTTPTVRYCAVPCRTQTSSTTTRPKRQTPYARASALLLEPQRVRDRETTGNACARMDARDLVES